MAKSLKSKHRRKMRAEKRLKNDKKVLKKLQETVKKTNIVLTPAMVKFKEKAELIKQEKATSTKPTPMEVSSTKKMNALTRLSKTGKFPVWANKRIRGEMMRKTNRLRNNKSGHLVRKRRRK